MTEDELRDKSYRVATGALLTETLSFEEYGNATEDEIEDLLWEQVQEWGGSEVSFLIESLAGEIESTFSECLT